MVTAAGGALQVPGEAEVKLAVIGCGNVGTRALQALAKLDGAARFYAMDPDERGHDLARQRLSELSATTRPNVSCVKRIDDLPDDIDLALITTCADVRRAVVDSLLDHARVRYLILEKFLFQKPSDFAAVGERLESAETIAWVNCTRRAWPGYAWLRDRLRPSPGVDQGIEMRVHGSNYALASNAIHYLDLYAYLTGVPVSNLDGSMLEEDRTGNRRSGYREIVGTLRGCGSCGAPVSLTSYPGSHLPGTVQFVSELGHYIVDEGEKRLRYVASDTEWRWREESFVSYEVSGMTPVYRNILDRGACALTPYAEAAAMHRDLIEVYNRLFFGSHATADQACPIT